MTPAAVAEPLKSSSTGAAAQMILATLEEIKTKLSAAGKDIDFEHLKKDMLVLASKLVRQARELYRIAA